MQDAFIISAMRTPVGKYGGVLSQVRADDLLGFILKSVVEKSGIPKDRIDDVIIGCANQAGEDNRNVGRMGVLLAGLPVTTPATTINRLCGSALDAISMACRTIKCGEADIMIAGGVEVMSRAPYVFPKNVSGKTLFGNLTAFDTALGWRFPNSKMEAMFPLEQMGETAENVAEKWNISREAQDEFALRSHKLASLAWDEGKYNDTGVNVEIPQIKGEPLIVKKDEGPRFDSTIEKLSLLKPAFRKGGSVTAGNSSSLNDGAGAVVIVSEKILIEYNLKPLLRYVSYGVAGLNPQIMGVGPVHATHNALKNAGLTINDIGLTELNEAFASQSLAVIHDLELDINRVNLLGGAISIGHPLGMSGARLISTLSSQMPINNVRYGLATMCVGVGQGISMIVENCQL
ncbi:MAG: thiolase family protein [Chlorobi bacterium]|nr:thiolase family protein [Chlorobiota bacterium]